MYKKLNDKYLKLGKAKPLKGILVTKNEKAPLRDKQNLLLDNWLKILALSIILIFILQISIQSYSVSSGHTTGEYKSDQILTSQVFYNSPLPTPIPLTCYGDGISGPRIKVFYLSNKSAGDNFTTYEKIIENNLIEANTILLDGSSNMRAFRFYESRTNDNLCSPTISNLGISTYDISNPALVIDKISQDILNKESSPTNALVVDDTQNNFCGLSSGNIEYNINGKLVEKTIPSLDNTLNKGGKVSVISIGCLKYPQVITHELFHTMGAVAIDAPNHSANGHCLVGYDLMCYDDTGTQNMNFKCPNVIDSFKLDCSGDTYFSLNPIAGGYLATHWNVANSVFLENLQYNDANQAYFINEKNITSTSVNLNSIKSEAFSSKLKREGNTSHTRGSKNPVKK